MESAILFEGRAITCVVLAPAEFICLRDLLWPDLCSPVSVSALQRPTALEVPMMLFV